MVLLGSPGAGCSGSRVVAPLFAEDDLEPLQDGVAPRGSHEDEDRKGEDHLGDSREGSIPLGDADDCPPEPPPSLVEPFFSLPHPGSPVEPTVPRTPVEEPTCVAPVIGSDVEGIPAAARPIVLVTKTAARCTDVQVSTLLDVAVRLVLRDEGCGLVLGFELWEILAGAGEPEPPRCHGANITDIPFTPKRQQDPLIPYQMHAGEVKRFEDLRGAATAVLPT